MIKINDVKYSYENSETEALRGVSISIADGEFVAIVGHNGSGKSTLAKMLNALQLPSSGSVTVFGMDTADESKTLDIRKKVGMVFQNPDNQIVTTVVEEDVGFGPENLGVPTEEILRRVHDALEAVDMLDYAKSAPHMLSGGQKQRLITASTLAMGQKIIILDEPLANLDKDGAAMLMGTLRSLAKAGYCVIVIEHRLDMVLPFVDTVWHIGNQTVRKIGNRQEYLQQQTAQIEDSCPAFTGSEPLFKLENVAFSVKKEREILKEITLGIPKGGRTVFLGENGCGKTTLMRLIARLYKPSGGNITQYIDEKFKQKPKGSKAWYKKVGVVYQNPDYQLFMPTVRQEISFGAKSEEYAAEIAELFGVAQSSVMR